MQLFSSYSYFYFNCYGEIQIIPSGLNVIKYFLSLFSIKSLVLEAAYLSRVRLFFLLFWLKMIKS